MIPETIILHITTDEDIDDVLLFELQMKYFSSHDFEIHQNYKMPQT